MRIKKEKTTIPVMMIINNFNALLMGKVAERALEVSSI